MTLIRHPGRLAPSEIRFLRKWLGWSGVDFAKHMGVAPETVSRWESVEAAKPMGGTAERLLRLAVAHGQPIEQYPIEMLTEISDDQVPRAALLAMKPDRTGWAPTTLAA
jgi:transcriptional regulator with XRE-family HTH domain